MTKQRKDPYGAVRVAATRHCRKDPMPIGTVVIREDKTPRKHGRPKKKLVRHIKVKDDVITEAGIRCFGLCADRHQLNTHSSAMGFRMPAV